MAGISCVQKPKRDNRGSEQRDPHQVSCCFFRNPLKKMDKEMNDKESFKKIKENQSKPHPAFSEVDDEESCSGNGNG